MSEIRLAPFDIYYSQRIIVNCFKGPSEHMGNLIGETIDDIILKRYRIDDVPKIRLVRKGDVWVSADNRRLWILKP